MTAKVYRFNPEVDKAPYYDTFEVEVRPEERMTVMNLLEYIGNNYFYIRLLFLLELLLHFFFHIQGKHLRLLQHNHILDLYLLGG